ncbi:MAG TPA: CaiB/BaiF CoA-transferase family protein [Vicinamibacterales bacterium]|nr:CaiB/BaiF CoA-transferase family protein [Vicinamibacterales bacterium]
MRFVVSCFPMSPFDQLTVVSLEQAVAAPFATRQLADLGARVIKIERPGSGDFARAYDTTVKGLSSYFAWLNRSKESLTLDLKRPGGAEILDRLLSKADIFVQNVAPGAADRLGTAPASLRARYPALIVCTVSGYGTSGPYADRKAYDLLVQSEAGLLSLTGTPAAPAKVGISVADIAAGMYAYSGILAALYARASHGRGAAVDVSLFDALAEWMGAPAAYTEYGGTAPSRSGAFHASIAPYGPVPTADAQPVHLAVQNAAEWARLCTDVLQLPALATDARFATNPARVKNREALDREIATVTTTLTSAELVTRLDAADIAYARMNTMAEFLRHPQLLARGRWRDVDSPAGPIHTLAPPVSIDNEEPRLGPIPALGAHTEAILRELGYDAGTMAAWRAAGTI